MPRDEFDDDRPRRRRPRDDDDDEDRPSRSRRRDDDEDRPSRPRRRRDEGDIRPRGAKKKSNLPLILGIVGGVLLLCCGGGGFAVYYFGDKVVSETREQQANNTNLKKIGLAMHNYQDRMAVLPNNTYDATGKPLLSWRVHLLPQLEQEALYAQFKLDEPWDGPNNRKLLSKMPQVYATPNMRAEDGKTYYRGFSHQGAVFERPLQPPFRKQVGLQNMIDGVANTILVVESGDLGEWTKPDDIDWQLGRPMPALGAGRVGDRVQVLMGDGSVRSMRKSMTEQNWRALITYSGNEIVDPDG
jgi:hypothetical protein